MGFGFFHSNGETSLSLGDLCASYDRDEIQGPGIFKGALRRAVWFLAPNISL